MYLEMKAQLDQKEILAKQVLFAFVNLTVHFQHMYFLNVLIKGFQGLNGKKGDTGDIGAPGAPG